MERRGGQVSPVTVYPERVSRGWGGRKGRWQTSDRVGFGHEGEVLTVIDGQGIRRFLHLVPNLTTIEKDVGSDLC